MIQYSLKCAEGHNFDSWFQSAEAYDKLAGAGMVTCAICGGSKVEKAIMAPRVRPGRKAVSAADVQKAEAAEQTFAAPVPQKEVPQDLRAPMSDMERAIRELKRKVEENSDYVGKDFVSEARAMHVGEAPERAIYGEARLEDAKELVEEGIPVLPLPFGPSRKTN